MEKRNIHGALWSEADEGVHMIGLVQADELEEQAEQAKLFREYGVDLTVYDEEELEDIFEQGDIVLIIKDGEIKGR